MGQLPSTKRRKRNIRIEAGQVALEAELNETETATAVWDALPIQAQANTWGDEIYFEIPVRRRLHSASSSVAPRRAGGMRFGLPALSP